MQLNYFPIKFDFERYQIYCEPYAEERLIELRRFYNHTHSFFRNGDKIYISNKEGNPEENIGLITERSVYENSEITSSLIKHIFFRTFKDRFSNYIPVDFYPFRFFSKQAKDDILFKELPEHLRNRVAYKKLIEVQLRLTEMNGIQQFGFFINIKRNWVFDINCEVLNSEGFELQGVEVLHAEVLPTLENILAPNEEFVGEIRSIQGSEAQVLTNEGIQTFPLNELYIKKNKLNISNYLSHKLSQRESDRILDIIEKKRSEIYNTKNLYNQILNIAIHLFKNDGENIIFQNKDGFCFTVESTPYEFTDSIQLQKPTFIFDYAGTKTNNISPDLGLINYGPYDSLNFDIKSPLVFCICNRINRGYFSSFLSKLKDGIPSSSYFQKGLLKKYDLQEIAFEINEIESYDTISYLKAISNYENNKPHLAIIEIPNTLDGVEDKDSPYYKVKAKLLSLEIPVQFITTDKMKNPNEYILNSIALQIYAKLGGTPWVLPSHRSVDKEIIIGIGHSIVKQNQYVGADSHRVVGITTFLSSDGQYLLGDKVKDVSFEDYFDELLKSLRNSIKRLANEQGWSKGDTIRLIFHIFKPIKNTEFEVISQLIKENHEYKIMFAFITISKKHPIRLFDKTEKGVSKHSNSPKKGEYIPKRGSNIFLDPETCVVQMFGANELKTALHGMSIPIQIRIRTPQGNYDNTELNSLLFYDLRYITQQIFSFTYLSWRSFLPAEQPATMLYSNLISKLISKMRNVEGWNPDSLNYGLKRKKWFL